MLFSASPPSTPDPDVGPVLEKSGAPLPADGHILPDKQHAITSVDEKKTPLVVVGSSPASLVDGEDDR